MSAESGRPVLGQVLRARFALIVVVAWLSSAGCWGNEPRSASAEQHDPPAHDKATAEDRFAENLVARANTYCRCRPPLPPRFPSGDDEDEVKECVAQQAAQLLEDALTEIRIEGPPPAVDTVQQEMLSDYLEERKAKKPEARACDLRMWMEAVALAANDSRSSGEVVNIPIMRLDRRHPSMWSDVGFMSASTDDELTEDAEPARHYAYGSTGSQVWVSATSQMSGIEAVLFNHLADGSLAAKPDVCIEYRHDTHEFAAINPLSGKCVASDGDDVAWDDAPRIITPLMIAYVYSTVTGTDVYRPEVENLQYAHEREVLSLGFRPSAYKGVVVLTSDVMTKFYTKEYDIRYNDEKVCEAFARPTFQHSTPFDGLAPRVVRETAGVDCRGRKRLCIECAALTAPASSCAARLVGSP